MLESLSMYRASQRTEQRTLSVFLFVKLTGSHNIPFRLLNEDVLNNEIVQIKNYAAVVGCDYSKGNDIWQMAQHTRSTTGHRPWPHVYATW